MSSDVFICNLALGNIGKPTINALTEKSAEARECSRFFEHTRDLLLQAYPWRWAGKTAALAEITNDKPGEWGYAYRKPTDCLKVRYVRPQYDATTELTLLDQSPEAVRQREAQWIKIPYELEGTSLYCGLSPALLRYTYRITDPTKFPPMFIEAFGWHLAVRLAMPLTKDPKVRADAFKLAMSMQSAAETGDANEQRETSDIDSDLVQARG